MSRKRNWEKIESEQAEKEKRQSEERERTIAELFRAIEQLESSKKQPGEGILADARELAAQWKVKKRPLFEGLLENNRLALLVALVVALRSSHQCLEKIRRYLPNELENLISATEHREFRALVSALSGTLPEPSLNRKYERKRRRWQRSFSNSIEYQFGGGLETEWKKQNLLFRPDYKSFLSSRQDCLADIFAGQNVNMLRLEDLFFGIERHQLAKLLSGEDKKHRKYGHRVVVKIMDALLAKRPRKKRKRSTPGRPRRMPWLNDADLRVRVLTGIEAWIKSIASELREADLDQAGQDYVRQWQEEIADPFLAMVRGHLSALGKK
jgi:hypothetical protein